MTSAPDTHTLARPGVAGALLLVASSMACGSSGSSDGDDPIPTDDDAGNSNAGSGGSGQCEPLSCEEAAAECGLLDDGCGRKVDCGECAAPLECAGAGVAYECGCPPTCNPALANCGQGPNLCGDLTECGQCDEPYSCGAAGIGNVCAVAPEDLLCTQSGYCWHLPLPHGADFGDAAFSGETGWAVAGGGIIQRYERGDWAPSRAPTSSHLRGVSGDGSSSWAVGDGGVVLNWNGTQWNEVAVPTSEDLNAVWQQTPDDVWVAGNAGALLHFDGTDWIAETGVSGVDFLSLWGNGSDEVWLGGRSGVMRHHAGAGWQVVDSGTTFDVYDIWGASGTDLWATASNYSCTVLVFCNAHGRVLSGGTSGLADVFSRNTNFRTLWARSAESVWVGGTGASYEGSEAGFSALGNSSHYTKIRGAEPRPTFAFGTRGVIRTWNGASWSTSRDEHLEGAIVDLHVLEDDDVWAVRRSPPIGTQRPSVLRWTGGGWLELSPDVPGPSGIWASGSEDVLVSWGNVASGGLTRFDGTLWTRSEMPDGTGELNAVDGSSSENVLSVGNDGQTLHFDGQRWARLPFPTTADLHDVVTVSPSMAVAVGVSGTVGVFDGSEWTLATAPTDETLYGIWSDGSDYWVVGDGVILHGTDPRSLALRTDWPSDDVYWLNDVTKTPDGAVYIVATRGNVLRLESDAWFHDDLGTARSFHAVAVSPSRVWLGGNGLVERRLEIP